MGLIFLLGEAERLPPLFFVVFIVLIVFVGQEYNDNILICDLISDYKYDSKGELL